MKSGTYIYKMNWQAKGKHLVRDKLRLKSSEISWMKLFKNINTVKAGNGNRAWKKKQEE